MSKPRRYEAIFEIDEKGSARVYNRNLLEKFFGLWPGRRLLVTFALVGNSPKDPLRGYYFAEVVTKFQIALRGYGYNFTKEETHEFIKQFSPAMRAEYEINGKIFSRYRSISDDDFSNEDFREYIDDLKRAAAEEFSIIINDPGHYTPLLRCSECGSRSVEPESGACRKCGSINENHVAEQ